MLPELVSQLKRAFILTRFRRLGRQRNPANETLAQNVFPLEIGHVGEKTYGPQRSSHGGTTVRGHAYVGTLQLTERASSGLAAQSLRTQQIRRMR
jgi:hypothetical protein